VPSPLSILPTSSLPDLCLSPLLSLSTLVRQTDAEDDAYKKYNRSIRVTKPDLLSYERSKEAALGLAPGTLVPINATATTMAVAGPSRGLSAAEDLYRGADTLAYGDNKPSEDAIDRVIGKINKE
jgi:pre-mRNA-splicing factor SYF2